MIDEQQTKRVESALRLLILGIVATCMTWGFTSAILKQQPPPMIAISVSPPPADESAAADESIPALNGAETPSHAFTGWSPEARDVMREWTAQQADFQLVSKGTGEPIWQDNRGSKVLLWNLKCLVIGRPPPNGPQLTGDCTAWSSCHGAEDTLAGQLVGRVGEVWQQLCPMWSYGVGRVEIYARTRALPAQGCSVAAIAAGMQKFGVLAWEDAKDAHGTPYAYSGRLADQWGSQGPPKHLYAVAAKHKLGNVAPLRSAAELRDSVCNSYGTACGSDFTAGNFRVVDGRVVADNITPSLIRRQPDKVWHHALCIDGYDGTAEHGPWYHIQNSWYDNSHPAPVDDSPPCGFWVSEAVIEYMVSKGDAFSFSDFEGFVDRRESIDSFFTAPPPPPEEAPQPIPAAPSPQRGETSQRKTQVAP